MSFDLTERPFVFVATLGNAAPVITLALDQLIQKHPFVEVCIIHTDDTSDPERAAKGLATMHETIQQLDQEFINRQEVESLEGEKKWEADYKVGNGRHRLTYRRVLIRREIQIAGKLPSYTAVRDVETEENAKATFRTIYRVLRQYKEQRAIIHLSIAGGRKSMSVFGMSSAQLLFWPEDKVWHVVSRDEFMNSRAMHDTTGQSLLVPIPVIRLSAASPVLGTLLTSSDPYDAIAAQENFMHLMDVRRKEGLLAQLDADERQILVGVAQGLSNEAIGLKLTKPLKGKTVANKLTLIYAEYIAPNVPANIKQATNEENVRTHLAAEFGTYFQQKGERL